MRSEMVKLIEKMKGYKATDKEMKCRGFQFELDKWHEHSGDIELCNSGFHFCVYPSGVYCYYDLCTHLESRYKLF